MRGSIRSTATWRRLARILVVGAGVLLLAGCMTGYTWVQPNAPGSGGYYTSAAPYTGQGYYDVYGTGPYYPGTSAWGYYNGSFPYNGWFDYYGGTGGYYNSFVLWPTFTFGTSFSNVWNFPGYWGPRYTTRSPFWRNCRYRHCDWRHNDYHHHRQQRRNHHFNPTNLGVMSLRPALPSGHTIKTETYSVRPANLMQQRQAAVRTAFMHDRFVHAPVRGFTMPQRMHPRRIYRPELEARAAMRMRAAHPTVRQSSGFHFTPRARPATSGHPRVRSAPIRPVAPRPAHKGTRTRIR